MKGQSKKPVFAAWIVSLSVAFSPCAVFTGEGQSDGNDETIEESLPQENTFAQAYRQLLEPYIGSNESFYIADLDGGGVPELLLTDACENNSYHDGMVDVYTFANGTPLELGGFGSWNSICVIQDQGVLLDTYLWSGGEGGTSYYRIDDEDPEHIHFLLRVNQEIADDGSFVRRLADQDGDDLPDKSEGDVDSALAPYSGETVRYAVRDSMSTQDDENAVIMLPVTEENVSQQLGEESSEGVAQEDGTSWQQAYWEYLLDCLYDPSQSDDRAFCVDDMDGDGIPEIALADNNTAHYNGVTIYTWQDGQVLELGGFGGNGGCEVCKERGIIRGAHSGQGASITMYCQIDHSVPEGIRLLCRVDSYTSESGTVYNLVDENGNSIQSLTEDEYSAKIQEYESAGTYTEYTVPNPDGTYGYAEYYPDWVPLTELTYVSICEAVGYEGDFDSYWSKRHPDEYGESDEGIADDTADSGSVYSG